MSAAALTARSRRQPEPDTSKLVNFILLSGAAHVIFAVAAVWAPWKSDNLLDEISSKDTMEIALSDSAPPSIGGPPAAALAAPKAPASAAPESKHPEPVAAPEPKAAPAPKVVPSVDKAAVPLQTKERSLEDRKRLEKAERTKAEKAVKETAKPDKHAPAKTVPDEKSAKMKEIEDRLAQKLREAREAVALANKYGSEAGTRQSSSASSPTAGTPAPVGQGSVAGPGGQPGGTGNSRSLLAAADRVQRDAYEGYRSQIMAAVRDNWEVPASVKGLALEATFRLEISSDGDVLSARLSKSSGNRVFDDAVSRTVSKVTNIGIPPANFPKIVNIVFDNRSLEQ